MFSRILAECRRSLLLFQVRISTNENLPASVKKYGHLQFCYKQVSLHYHFSTADSDGTTSNNFKQCPRITKGYFLVPHAATAPVVDGLCYISCCMSWVYLQFLSCGVQVQVTCETRQMCVFTLEGFMLGELRKSL